MEDGKLGHIEWAEPAYEDRLVLSFEGSNVIKRADFHAVIRGKVYACVRIQATHSFGTSTHFETYKIGPDGFAKRATSDGGRPMHYEVVHEGKTVILLNCNGYGEVPRRVPCSMCKAKREAA